MPGNLYLTRRFFIALLGTVLLFVVGYIWGPVTAVGAVVLSVLALLCAIDILLLYRWPRAVFARRELPERFSNGDENPVDIHLENRYPFAVRMLVIDEVPVQFQMRHLQFPLDIDAGRGRIITYSLRPVRRGAYHFGAIRVLVSSALGLVRRRYSFDQNQMRAVYPSFVQMRQYQLMAFSSHLRMAGLKKVRQRGSSREFEQIEHYVPGDDYRKINWKATARKGELMVNHYQDERSQPIYLVIDKGRSMQMPFGGLSLLDYAINSSLVMANIALRKGDRPGLITFEHRLDSLLPASSRPRQLHLIMEQLYRQETDFRESDPAILYTAVRRAIPQRSLLLLFTNYESHHALERELPYLRLLNRHHLLVCIFFENTELRQQARAAARGMEEVYTKGVAETLMYQKRLMARELQRQGILALLTPPEDLNVRVINTYLEIKARGWM